MSTLRRNGLLVPLWTAPLVRIVPFLLLHQINDPETPG